MPRKYNPEWPSQSRERKAVYRNTRIAKLKNLFDSGQRQRVKSKRCSRCDTGAIRALLCTKCNTMLGAADESAEILTAAMVYLERHKK